MINAELKKRSICALNVRAQPVQVVQRAWGLNVFIVPLTQIIKMGVIMKIEIEKGRTTVCVKHPKRRAKSWCGHIIVEGRKVTAGWCGYCGDPMKTQRAFFGHYEKK